MLKSFDLNLIDLKHISWPPTQMLLMVCHTYWKCPLQSSTLGRFSCRASNFSYSLAQWLIAQAIHLYFKLNHHLTQACNISGASKMFKLLALRTSWNSSFLFKPWILFFHHELSLQECTPHSIMVLEVSKNSQINQKNKKSHLCMPTPKTHSRLKRHSLVVYHLHGQTVQFMVWTKGKQNSGQVNVVSESCPFICKN